MSNVDKVEEKVKEDVDKAIKTSKTRAEFEQKLDPNDVSYKIRMKRRKGSDGSIGQTNEGLVRSYCCGSQISLLNRNAKFPSVYFYRFIVCIAGSLVRQLRVLYTY
jgi:hypothetical protein